jgi:hypothetical protein
MLDCISLLDDAATLSLMQLFLSFRFLYKQKFVRRTHQVLPHSTRKQPDGRKMMLKRDKTGREKFSIAISNLVKYSLSKAEGRLRRERSVEREQRAEGRESGISFCLLPPALCLKP